MILRPKQDSLSTDRLILIELNVCDIYLIIN